MTWVAVGVAGASMLVAGMQQGQSSINDARAITAQNRAKIKHMQDQFELSTQNMYNNEQLIKQQKMRNDVTIQENKLEAMDLFAQAFGGSGVSGRTVDILESEIARSVSEAQTENERQAQQQSDIQFLGLMRQAEANIRNIDNLAMFDISSAQANQDMAIMASGISSFGSAANSGKFDKYFK